MFLQNWKQVGNLARLKQSYSRPILLSLNTASQAVSLVQYVMISCIFKCPCQDFAKGSRIFHQTFVSFQIGYILCTKHSGLPCYQCPKIGTLYRQPRNSEEMQ